MGLEGRASDGQVTPDVSILLSLLLGRALIALSTRSKTRDRFSVDLHGLNISEAITVARESVDDWWNDASGSSRKSLVIITGRGNHSKNQVGVIGPAVQKDLEQSGWNIRRSPGNITITGRRNS